MVFLLFFLIPIIIALAVFFFSERKITVKEFLVQSAIQGIIAVAISATIYNNNTSDIEVLHGQVTGKSSEHVSCSHSYSCNCYTTCSGSGENQSCTEHCSTCYEHSYDVSWIVRSQIGSVEIDRIDRQGLDEPSRYSKAQIGEPFSQTRTFENFIKGSPDTLFKRQGLVEKYKGKIPDYFSKVFDYYRINRVINLTLSKSQDSDLNKMVSELNKTIGPQKTGSLGLVIIPSSVPREYYYALEEAWLGGKKNDIIPVIALNEDGSIAWVEVMGWVKDPLFKVKLRDDLLELNGIGNIEKLSEVILSNVSKYYIRKPIKDFEYLKSSIKPSVNQFIIGLILALIASVITSFIFYRTDFFEEERYSRFR